MSPERDDLRVRDASTVDSGDNGGVELGVKFRADFDGAATGIRFYKAAANTGTHIGSVWTEGGTLLASATFTGEAATGWQSVTFSSPVDAHTGHDLRRVVLRAERPLFGHRLGVRVGDRQPATRALANGTSSNGVFAYGASSRFPTGTGRANYWVDVLFAPAPPPGPVSNVIASAGQTSASVSWSAPSPSAGGPVTSYEVTPYIGSTPQTAKRKTLTGTPPATNTTISGLSGGTAYTFTVRALNTTGAGPESGQSNSVTPTASATPGTPTGVSARGDSKAAIVGWTEPADGGSPITGYTVTPYIGSAAQAPTQVDGSVSRARITGLTNGTAYSFRVSATNAAGTGSASSDSNAATPRPSIFESGRPRPPTAATRAPSCSA